MTGLLWVRCKPPSLVLDLPDVPSWSWAATSGSKDWPLETLDNVRYQALYRELTLIKPELRVSGYLSSAYLSLVDISSCLNHEMFFVLFPPSYSFSCFISYMDCCARIVFDNDTRTGNFGLCAFDSEPFPEVFLLFVASPERWKNDPW